MCPLGDGYLAPYTHTRLLRCVLGEGVLYVVVFLHSTEFTNIYHLLHVQVNHASTGNMNDLFINCTQVSLLDSSYYRGSVKEL